MHRSIEMAINVLMDAETDTPCIYDTVLHTKEPNIHSKWNQIFKKVTKSHILSNTLMMTNNFNVFVLNNIYSVFRIFIRFKFRFRFWFVFGFTFNADCDMTKLCVFCDNIQLERYQAIVHIPSNETNKTKIYLLIKPYWMFRLPSA